MQEKFGSTCIYAAFIYAIYRIYHNNVCAAYSVTNMLELAILLPSSLRSLRPSCACSFICILHQSVTKMCATLSVSIVLKLAFRVTKQLHPPQIAKCYYCTKNVLL